jgi:hypothetical protein
MLYALLFEGWTMTLMPSFTNFLTWLGDRGALLSQTLIVSLLIANTPGKPDIPLVNMEPFCLRICLHNDWEWVFHILFQFRKVCLKLEIYVALLYPNMYQLVKLTFYLFLKLIQIIYIVYIFRYSTYHIILQNNVN